jgi:hypothetical protein
MEPISDPYPEPDEFSRHPLTLFTRIYDPLQLYPVIPFLHRQNNIAVIVVVIIFFSHNS